MSRGNHRNRKGLFSSKGAGANVIDQSIDVRAEAIAAIASCAARFARRRQSVIDAPPIPSSTRNRSAPNNRSTKAALSFRLMALLNPLASLFLRQQIFDNTRLTLTKRKKSMLRPSKDHSTKRNAPELDYSSFYGTTGTGRPAALWCRFSVPHEMPSQSVPRGDSAP